MPKHDELVSVPFVADSFYVESNRMFYPLVWWGEPYAKETLVFIDTKHVFNNIDKARSYSKAAAKAGLIAILTAGWQQFLSSDRNGKMWIKKVFVPKGAANDH